MHVGILVAEEKERLGKIRIQEGIQDEEMKMERSAFWGMAQGQRDEKHCRITWSKVLQKKSGKAFLLVSVEADGWYSGGPMSFVQIYSRLVVSSQVEISAAIELHLDGREQTGQIYL